MKNTQSGLALVSKESSDRDELNFVYTDGACRGNGTPTARASIGVYFGPGDDRNVYALVEGRQTNNVAEVTAILRALDVIGTDGASWVIVTDSTYAMRWAGSLGEKNAVAGWTKAVPNKTLVRRLYEEVSGRSQVRMQKVAAHTNGTDQHSVGNRWADTLANRALDRETQLMG
jgi:ribonuclease HI